MRRPVPASAIEPNERLAFSDPAPAAGSVREQLLSALTDEQTQEARALLAGLSAAADRRVFGSRQVDALENEFARLTTLASRDELTGLYNRRAFIGMGTKVLNLAARLHLAPLLIYCDVNGLKLVNDHAGHSAGDELLRRAADALRSAFRDTDLVARLGGDEFAALVGMDSALGGRSLTQRVRRAVAEANRGTPRFQLSLSIGMAAFVPSQPTSLADLISAADAAMYHRKRAQRSVVTRRATRA
jgi:diguanylate cyclase (GGDEF)-like protein